MVPSSLTARAIIGDLLGGRREVARITGATPNAVAQWYRIGIPAKFWPAIQAVAAERGIPGVTFAALAATKAGSGDRPSSAAEGPRVLA